MRSIYVLGCAVSLAIAGAYAPSSALAAPPNASAAHASGTLPMIQKQAVLRVGVAVNAPWVLRDKQDQWSGLDIDLVRELGQEMRWKVELVPTTWATAIDDLNAGRFDLLANGLSITPQRALRVKFSQPYGEFALGLAVNRQKLGTDDLVALERGSQHKIGVLAGTLTEATAKEYLGNSEVVEIDDESKAIEDLRDGKLDGLLAEQPLPDAIAHAYASQLRTIDVSAIGKTAHGFAVRRGDQDLLDVVNAWLISQQAKGWIQSREEFWIHSAEWVSLM